MAKHPFPWQAAFLASLRDVPVVARACEAVGIERSTAYRAREASPEFAEAWDDAMESGIDRAEQEAFRRGVQGYEEPVLDKGRLTYQHRRVVGEDGAERFELILDEQGQPIPLTVRKHSDALLALLLKGRRKKVYAERVETTGADGGPVKVQDDTTRSARVAQLMALAQRRRELQAAEDQVMQDFGDLA